MSLVHTEDGLLVIHTLRNHQLVDASLERVLSSRRTANRKRLSVLRITSTSHRDVRDKPDGRARRHKLAVHIHVHDHRIHQIRYE